MCVAAIPISETNAKLAAMDSRVFQHTHDLQFKENHMTLCAAYSPSFQQFNERTVTTNTVISDSNFVA